MSEILFNKIQLGSGAIKGLQLGSSLVKFCKLGSSLIYDTFSHYIYDTPTITVTYPTLSRNGGSVTPTVKYTQKRTKVGYSGQQYSSDTISGTVTSFTASGSAINSSGATIVSTTGVVSRDSLGTTLKNSEWNIMNVTISATINGKSGSGSTTVKMQSNTVVSYAYSDPVLNISNNLTAAGGYVDVTAFIVSRTPTYQTTSVGAKETGINVTANATYTYTGTRFTRSGLRYNHDNMTTNIATDTLSITATYEGQSNTKTASVSNSRSLVSVYLVPYQPDNTWIGVSGSGSSATWNTIPRTGGYIQAKAYANYTHTSGSPLNDQQITNDAELSWSTGYNSWITDHTVGYYIGTRANSISNSNRTATATWSYTYNGTTKTATKSITQQNNMIKSVALTVNAGDISKSGTAGTMGGDISITNSTSPSCSGIATLEAGSCSITLSTYGTLTGPSYSWSENTDYTTITGNGATATLTFGENMTLSDRSATATRTASYSYSINSAYLASGGTQTSNKAAQDTVSVSQSKGYYTYSNPYDLSCTYGNVTAVGGTSSPSISYKQTYGWNGRTSGVGTITGGSSDDGHTTYSISKTCTGLSIASDTGIVTWAKNNVTSGTIDSQRSGEVTMTVTRNNKTAELSGIKTTQLGEAVSSYGNWTFNVTLGTPNIAASGGNSTITISRPTRTVTLDTGDTVTETASTGIFAVTSSNSSFTLNSANGSMTSSGVPSFTVSVGGAGAAAVNAISSTIKVVFTSTNPTTGTTTAQVSKTVNRNASVYSDHEFRFSQFDGLTTSINAAAKSMTLTMVVQRRDKYTGSSNWASWYNIAPADGSIVLTCSNATSSAVSEGTSSNSYKSTSTISISANQISDSYTTSARTITVSGKYTNGSKSCTSSTITINQSADAISSYGTPTAPVIGSGLTAGGGSASLSTASTVTNTYVSGKTLAGSVSYILGTSTFTNSSNSTSSISRFSVDGSTGKVTHTTMGTNVGTDKVSVIARNTGDTSKIATSNTISISNAARASFSGITITSFTYSGNIPAGGGEITPSVSYTQTPYYTSGSAGTAITSGGTLTYTITNSRFTLSSGKVSGGNRTTNIGNEITDTITVKVTLNGKEATKTVTVKQLGNYVTSIAVKDHTFSYDNIGAGATASGNPKCVSTPEYTFSSGSKSTTTPSTTYGSLSSSASYSIANKTTNGFTNINQTSGVLTATSRGVTYGASTRSSAQVTRTITYTWTPTSSYNSAGTKTGSGNAYATCTQNANIFTSAAWTNISGGAIGNPGTYSAGGQTKKVTNSTSPSASVTLTLSSGSKVDSGTYGVISGPTYSWSSNQTYATLTSDNKSELNVAMSNRLASTGSARQATITRNAAFTFALKTDYKEVSSCVLSRTVSATVTITQEANAENAYYRYKEMVVQLSNNLTAGGGYTTPSATATKVGYYTSGSEGASTTVNITGDCTFADTEWFNTSDSATSGSTISRFNWDTTNKRYNHLSMGVNPGYDYLYTVATNTSYTWLDLNTAKSNTIKVYNGIVNTLGGVTTYGTLTAGTITNATIPASGTTTNYTATAGNGSQTYSTTRKYYLYTSGSEKTISEATSGSVTISPNIASISATAGSKGVVTSGVTEVKKQAVTWASKDGDTSKDKAGIMYIYQAANAITGYSLPQPTGIKWNALIPAKGGTATPTINQVKQLYSYTSGASQWVNVSPSISYARAQAVHGTDPEFYNGINSIYLYDNNSSGKTTLTRVTSGIPSGCPNNSGVAYKISNTGSGTQPGLGGFYFGYAGASGQTYIMTFDAWVPSGYSLAHAYNSLGSGGSQQALTPMNGCGEWRTYSIQVYFGTSNSSAFFIYLSGTAGTSSSPVNWYVANAKICKVSNVSATTPTFNTSTGVINVGTRGTTQGVTGIADGYASVVATITANGQTAKVVAAPSQQANTYSDSGGTVSYGSWSSGKVSFSKSTLSAGADSCTVTISPWSRTKNISAVIRTWTSTATQTITSASSTTEYYTGNVAVGENGAYTSLSATSYTASSSNKTLTLTKTTCGTDDTDAQTITVTAVGPNSTSATIAQEANNPKASNKITSRGTPTIKTFVYGTNAANTAGATNTPTKDITCKDIRTYYWTSGSVHSTEEVQVTPTLTYSEVTNVSAASVNSSGVVTWNSNNWNTSTQRTVTIKLVAKNPNDTSKSAEKPAVATQNADTTYLRDYNTPVISNFKYDSSSVPVNGYSGSLSPSGSWTQTANYYWNSGGGFVETKQVASGTIDDGYSTYTMTSGTVNATTGVVTVINNNRHNSSSRTSVVTVTVKANNRQNTATHTFTVAADTQNTSWSWSSKSLSYSNAANTANATQSPSISYKLVKTVTWNSSGTQISSNNYTSGASISYSEIADSSNKASVNSSTGVVTWSSANQNTTSTRYCTVRASITLQGQSTTVDANATQNADSITTRYKNLTINASYRNVAAAGGSSSPSVTYSYTKETYYASGGTVTKTETLKTGGTISYSGSASGASLASNGTVTWGANSSTSTRSITVKVTVNVSSVGLSNYKNITCTQDANYITNGNGETQYEILDFSASGTSGNSSFTNETNASNGTKLIQYIAPASGDTITLSATGRYRTYYAWAVGNPTYSDWTTVTLGSSNITNGTISAGCSRSGMTVTVVSRGKTEGPHRDSYFTCSYNNATTRQLMVCNSANSKSLKSINSASLNQIARGGILTYTPTCTIGYSSGSEDTNQILGDNYPDFTISTSGSIASEKSGNNIQIVSPNNTSTLTKTGTVTISYGSKSGTINVTQAGGVQTNQTMVNRSAGIPIPYAGGNATYELGYIEGWNGVMDPEGTIITDRSLTATYSQADIITSLGGTIAAARNVIRIRMPQSPLSGDAEFPIAWMPIIVSLPNCQETEIQVPQYIYNGNPDYLSIYQILLINQNITNGEKMYVYASGQGTHNVNYHIQLYYKLGSDYYEITGDSWYEAVHGTMTIDNLNSQYYSIYYKSIDYPQVSTSTVDRYGTIYAQAILDTGSQIIGASNYTPIYINQ